jgi:probable HAF family extracellular repeat protein
LTTLLKQRTEEEDTTKTRKLVLIIAVTLMAALAIPVHAAAQDKQDHAKNHHHYKLIDMGTFGGPQSYFVYPDFTSEANVNNEGMAAGWADTPFPDPYPSFCFWDCYIDRAFQWTNGVRTDLGVLPGGSSSQPSWVSASGLISGWSQNGKIDPLVAGFPENRAVLWKDGIIRDLGTLPQPEGGYESLGFAVNSTGLVVGVATNTVPDANSMFGYGYEARAFVWDEQNGMQDLGTLGGTDAQAVLVNERGQVAGYSYTNSAPSSACASLGMSLTTGTFFWDKKNGMVNIGGLGGTCTNVLGFNNRGQIVGLSFLTGDQIIHAFRWDRAEGLKDLGTLGGNYAVAYANNDSGDVVGGSALPGGVPIDAAIWRNGGIIDLGGLPGGCGSFGFWINASDQVVGNAFNDCTFETTTGFLWEDGAPMADLNALIVPGSGFFVPAGNTINDRGEISANGVNADQHEHAVLLIPCDENHPGIEGCDYSLVDASTAAQSSVPRHLPNGTRRLPQSWRSNRYQVPGMARATIGTASEGTDPRPSASTNGNGLTEDFLAADNRMVSLSSKVGDKCTPRGHPCEGVPCCPGLVCKLSGGSTRVGYACEP